MNLVFSLKNVSKTYGDDTLFTDLSIDFKAGEQLGLIGMNGSGKSTLLKLVARLTEPDTGELTAQPGCRFVYLSQKDNFDPDQTIEEILFDTAKKNIFDEKEQHRIVQRAIGKGLFEDPAAQVKTLSGGWKKKLAITRSLCAKPDMLLLDEPTNHLDINGIIWLENILKTANFSFIAVSHDRTFLENICKNVMEIGRVYPEGYFRTQGQYKNFIKQREKFLIAQEKQQASLAGKMRREDAWLRQGPKARSTKAKYRIEQAGTLRQKLHAVKQRNKNSAMVNIDFDSTGRKTKKLLQAYNISKNIAGKQLFSNLTFELGPGFCLGVAGANGSGKSTFLAILEKLSPPDSGKVDWAQDLKIAVYDQTRSKLDQEALLKDALNPAGGDSVNYKGRTIHIVSWAKRFLFMPDQLEMPVKRLSGGEQARILIADIMLTPCDILFLDEPTNDLDILSLEVLEDSIKQFAGAVVIVSHDRYLMDSVCHKILYLDPASDSQFFTDFNQILAHRQKKNEKIVKPKKNQREKKSSIGKFSFKDKYELEHIEEKILKEEGMVEQLSQLIQQPEVLADTKIMSKHCCSMKLSQEKVQKLYDRWEMLEAKKAESEN
ncbi:MAG: ABC-F family ATP-binding cassette domain-containing protein [Desulfobacula sp.]|nr:ABC-F family ATP-binding cassette domain-containing protein [Desulfobacula sp.]